MVIMPALLQPYTRQITGSDDFAIGHFGSIGYWVAANVGRLMGDKSKSTEEINVPKGLGFLRDSSVAMALTMTLLFFVVALCAGPTFVESKLSGGQNFLIFSFRCSSIDFE